MTELKVFARYVKAVNDAQYIWECLGCNELCDGPLNSQSFKAASDLRDEINAFGPDAQEFATYIWNMFLIKPDGKPAAAKGRHER